MKKRNFLKKHYILFFSVIAILVILFSILFISINSKERKIHKQLELGQGYLLNQDYELALATFDRIIKLDDRNVAAYLGTAEAYIGLGKLEDAVNILKRGVDILSIHNNEQNYDYSADVEILNDRINEIQKIIDSSTVPQIFIENETTGVSNEDGLYDANGIYLLPDEYAEKMRLFLSSCNINGIPFYEQSAESLVNASNMHPINDEGDYYDDGYPIGQGYYYRRSGRYGNSAREDEFRSYYIKDDTVFLQVNYFDKRDFGGNLGCVLVTAIEDAEQYLNTLPNPDPIKESYAIIKLIVDNKLNGFEATIKYFGFTDILTTTSFKNEKYNIRGTVVPESNHIDIYDTKISGGMFSMDIHKNSEKDLYIDYEYRYE